MGQPKITQSHYKDNFTKYSAKRTKYTSDSFHEEHNQCGMCGGTAFNHERPLPTTKRPHYYRTYGYRTDRVQWRIRCANKSCSEPYGVILKLELWDSAGE